MSYWSPDGKRALRSRARSRNQEEDMPVPRRETRSRVKRNPSPEFELPVARQPEDMPVSRNPEDMAVSRDPNVDPDLHVARNPKLEDMSVSRDPDMIEIKDEPFRSSGAVEQGTAPAGKNPPESGNVVEIVEPRKTVVENPSTDSDAASADADGANVETIPEPSAIKHVPSKEIEKTGVSEEGKPASELEDFEPVSRLIRSGTPLPMEFVPFGDVPSAHDEKEPEDTNDIPHLTRRRSPRKPPYMLGEPYPIPQLRPRYWKPGAAEAVSGGGGGIKRKWDYRNQKGGKKPRMGPPTSATALLNEKYPGLQYAFSDPVGPPHSLIFTVTVNFPPLGGDFSATGTSKKSAKNNLAQLILSRLGSDFPQRMEQEQDYTLDENTAHLSSANEPIQMEPSVDSMEVHDPSLVPPNNQLLCPPTAANPRMAVDFASDDILDICSQSRPEYPYPLIQEQIVMPVPNVAHRLRNIPNMEENAVNALSCLLLPQKPTFTFVSEEGQPHEKTFVTKVQFFDLNQTEQTCIGKAGSKKKSKANAAIQAIIQMIGPDLFYSLAQRSLIVGTNLGKGNGNGPNGNGTQAQTWENMATDFEIQENNRGPFGDQYNLVFANHMKTMVMSKYEEIMVGEQNYISQKVIAGVVMTWGIPFTEHAAIIAVTTGTKCIEGDCMSTGGLALNDCHAEILATRCLRDYLFSQIDEFRSGDLPNENCIFESLPEKDGVKKFRLKEGLQFHLYISTSPCGDARIFSPKGLECEEDNELEPPGEEIIDNHPNRANRGVLRSKIEAGEGTIPVTNLDPGPQTWDAVMQGNALRTMSCSDKVCRWNVVGIQGALLSSLIEPIYYSSIVLGSLHHPVHFERAMYGRIERLSDQLQLPFKLNRPKLLMTSDTSKRQVKKSPNHAVLWSANWGSPEIVAASKGKCLRPEVASRVAKRLQFIRFLRLYKNSDGRRENYADLYYADAKMLASEYQNSLNLMKECFKKSGLGSWVSKPMEQDSFCVSK